MKIVSKPINQTIVQQVQKRPRSSSSSKEFSQYPQVNFQQNQFQQINSPDKVQLTTVQSQQFQIFQNTTAQSQSFLSPPQAAVPSSGLQFGQTSSFNQMPKTKNYSVTSPATTLKGTSQGESPKMSKMSDSYKYNQKQKSLISPVDTNPNRIVEILDKQQYKNQFSSTMPQQYTALLASKENQQMVRNHTQTEEKYYQGQSLIGTNNILVQTQRNRVPLSVVASPPQSNGIQTLQNSTVTGISGAQQEINKIAFGLRDILKKVQNTQGGNTLSDSLNDGILNILQSFRKLEEQLNSNTGLQKGTSKSPQNNIYQNDLASYQAKCQELQKRVTTMSDDYQKLKAIMDSLQDKMTVLVQENSKLNKSLMEYDSKLQAEIKQKREIKDNADQLQEELQRAMRCLENNQRDNEDLRRRITEYEQSDPVRRQLFESKNDDKQQSLNNLINEKNRMIEQLQYQNSRKQEELSKIQRELNYSRSEINNTNESMRCGAVYEQLELKTLSLQIENDNLKSELAHHQIDNKVIEQKQDMISKLEDRIRGLLKDKLESEQYRDQSQSFLKQLEQELKTLKNQLKETIQLNNDLSDRCKIIPQLEKDNDQIRQQIMQKESQISQYQRELQIKQENIQEYEKDKQQLNKRFSELEEQIQKERKEFNKEISQKEQEKMQLQNYFKNQIDKANQQVRERESQIERMQQGLEKYQEERTKLYERIDQNEKYVDSLNQSIQQQSVLQQSLLNQIETLKQNELQQRTQYERNEKSLKNAFDQSQREMEQLKVDFVTSRNSSTEQISQLEKNNQELRRYLQEQRENEGYLQEAIQKLNQQLELQKKLYQEANEDIQKRLRAEKQRGEDSINELQCQINILGEQKSVLMRSLKEAENRHSQYQTENEEKILKLTEQVELKTSQCEVSKVESEKLRSANYNLQEELLRSGMLISSLQNQSQGLKQELTQARQEQENLIELLKKRKEESSLLHESLEATRRELIKKQSEQEDGRRSIMKQQDLSVSLEQVRRENIEMRQQLQYFKNEIIKQKKVNNECEEKDNEIEVLRRKYDDTIQSLVKIENKNRK